MDIQLQNPEFTPPYVQQDGDRHLHVAQGWRAWWSLEPSGSHGGDHHRPEYYQKRYGEGDALSCQAWQTTHATHRAGLFQVVDLPEGVQSLRASIGARYYSQDQESGGRHGELALRLGLLPGAGSDGTSPDIRWGEWRGQTDATGWDGMTWQTLHAELLDCAAVLCAAVPCAAQRVTLFVESCCRWPVRNNHAFITGATATAAVAEQPEPGPPQPADLVDLLRDIRDQVRRIADAMEGRQ